MKTLIEVAVRELNLSKAEVIRNIKAIGGQYIDYLHNEIGECFELSSPVA